MGCVVQTASCPLRFPEHWIKNVLIRQQSSTIKMFPPPALFLLLFALFGTQVLLKTFNYQNMKPFKGVLFSSL